MKKLRKVLSLVLALIMMVSPSITSIADTTTTSSNDDFYKIVHVDAGRKYFSPANIKAIIDNAAEAGFNQVELYLSDNQGFRFALDEMTLTTSYDTYDLTPALGDGYTQTDGKAPDGSGKYLTQSEMTEIIAYAKTKGIEIVPCINVPGHMGAILEEFSDFRYSTSQSSIDLANEEAVAFALALTEKYVEYFAGQGLKYYNVGADEYANDMSSMGFEGMGATLYTKFVEFLNDAADIIIAAGMTPRAFNDGFYYKDYNISVTPNTAYEICYWSSGWSGYDVAAASTIAAKGHKMINTHGDYYWVLGNTSWQCTADEASQFDYTTFQGSTISDPAGAMFCIWCDNGAADGQDDGAGVVEDTADVITAFGATLPVTETTVENTTVSDTEDGVEVTGPGLTSLTCDQTTAPRIEGANNVLAFNMVPMVGTAAYTEAGVVSVEVPEGWNTDNMGAFVVDSDDSVTKISGTYANGVYTYACPHFSTTGIYDVAEAAEEDTNPTTGTITTVVNGEKTAELNGHVGTEGTYTTADGKVQYTITHNTETVAAGTTYKLGDSTTTLTSGNKYVIASGSNAISVNGTSYTNTTLSSTSAGTVIDENVIWTVTSSGNGYTISTVVDGTTYYLGYNRGLQLSTSSTTWTYSNNRLSYTTGSGWNQRTYYLRYNDGWSTSSKKSNSSTITFFNVTSETTSAETINTTTITFKGLAEGTTTVTVGSTVYSVTVAAEDLTAVEPLTIEYWITNVRVTADSTTSMELSATTDSVYSSGGAVIDNLVPENGTGNDDATVVFWKTTYLTGGVEQTTDPGDDETLSGIDFAYIRYWNGAWAYSADRITWNNIDDESQIVAYYLQFTEVTDEIDTMVVDWGVVPSTSYNSTNFVLVDYAVKYESGERVPDSFPVSGKTQAFHCDPSDTNTVHQYNGGSSNTWSNNYRDIGMIKAEETSEYEVYMITITPTSDSQTTQVAGNANSATSYTYSGTEKVIWVDDEANLGDFADESLHFTSITGEIKYTVGGEPIVPGLEIFNRHGMLVTYYVRAKATEDSLTVHYIDATEGANNLEFYNYNIAVKEGTYFNEAIALNTSNPNGDLLNGTVTNYYNKTQTVSADLSTLSQIGAQYLYTEYECIEVVRSTDGKHVYLYYKFNPTVYFMVDFGLPMDITATNLSEKLEGVTIDDMLFSGVSNTSYGKLADNGTTITYTPNKVFTGVDYFTLVVKTATSVDGILDSASTQIAFRVYVMPATTVYYEEQFATLSGFTTNGTANGGKQTTEIAGSHVNNYGYDDSYSKVEASNGTQATSTTYGDKAEFTFTGTGVDIYTNSTPTTGTIFIQVKNSSGSTVKMIQVKTALLNGTTDATSEQNVTGYNIPVASIDLGTAIDTYTVYITHVKPSSTATGDTVNLDGFRVYGTLALNTAAYVTDLEDNPEYYQLRDMVLHALNVNDSTSADYGTVAEMAEQVYNGISTDTEQPAAILSNSSYAGTNVQDLLDNGPKNELYLRAKETLIFKVKTERVLQLGMKALAGETSYKITGATTTEKTGTITSSTDMFYSLGNTTGTSTEYTITVTNTGSNILSITDLKICDDPNATFETLTVEDIELALNAMGYEDEPEYADATLNININDSTGNILATTQLTANGIVGETATFTASDIEAAVTALELPENYELETVVYEDTAVLYGEEATVSFTAEEVVEPEEPETENTITEIINKVMNSFKNFLNKIFGW